MADSFPELSEVELRIAELINPVTNGPQKKKIGCVNRVAK